MRVLPKILPMVVIALLTFGGSQELTAQDGIRDLGVEVLRSQESRRLLAETAEEMIRTQGELRVSGEVNRLFSGPHSEAYRDFVLEKAESSGPVSNYTYTRYDVSFVRKGLKATKAGITVSLTEHGVLTYANPANDSGMPKTEEYEYEHQVIFRLTDGHWKVVDDQVTNLPGPALPIFPSKGIQRNSTLPYSDFQGASPQDEAKSTAFSRASVASYALQYWSSYNSSYRSFSPTDCTNFVSQAMRAGGWTDVSGWYQSASHWWYNSLNQTWSWVNADLWGDFTYNRPRGVIASYISDLRVGDVLEADWNADGTVDHAMIVTSKTSSDIFLTYHSNNQKDKPFSTILADNPGTVWYGYLLSSSFN